MFEKIINWLLTISMGVLVWMVGFKVLLYVVKGIGTLNATPDKKMAMLLISSMMIGEILIPIKRCITEYIDRFFK